jgi:hypothetical protein
MLAHEPDAIRLTSPVGRVLVASWPRFLTVTCRPRPTGTDLPPTFPPGSEEPLRPPRIDKGLTP